MQELCQKLHWTLLHIKEKLGTEIALSITV